MPKHKDLVGNELHAAKISIEPPARAPAFIGETIFDTADESLWIAIGTTLADWKKITTATSGGGGGGSISGLFSWVLDASLLTSPYRSIRFFYAATQSAVNANTWTYLQDLYMAGGDLNFAYGSAAELNKFIERNGAGYYVPLLQGRDASLNTISYSVPLAVAHISLEGNLESTIVEIFNVPSFNGGFDATGTDIKGFRVKKPLAQVTLRLG